MSRTRRFLAGAGTQLVGQRVRRERAVVDEVTDTVDGPLFHPATARHRTPLPLVCRPPAS